MSASELDDSVMLASGEHPFRMTSYFKERPCRNELPLSLA